MQLPVQRLHELLPRTLVHRFVFDTCIVFGMVCELLCMCVVALRTASCACVLKRISQAKIEEEQQKQNLCQVKKSRRWPRREH